MKTNFRTWPYGTRKLVKVVHVSTVRLRGKDVPIVAFIEQAEPKEGFALIGADQAGEHARKDDLGTITFTKGGPTGGFWKYEPTPSPL